MLLYLRIIILMILCPTCHFSSLAIVFSTSSGSLRPNTHPPKPISPPRPARCAPPQLDSFVEDEALANLVAYLSFERWRGDPSRLKRVRKPPTAAAATRGETFSGSTIQHGDWPARRMGANGRLELGERMPGGLPTAPGRHG